MATEFMQQQVVEGEWLEVETLQGTTCIPYDDAPGSAQCFCDAQADGQFQDDEVCATVGCDLLEHLADTYDSNDVLCVRKRVGYGARLSAPGYLDCTEWTVFDSHAEAESHLEEMYGGD